MLNYKIITTIDSAVPLEYLKNYLRITNDEDDQLITNCYLTAREFAEQYINICLNFYDIEFISKIDRNYLNLPHRLIDKITSVTNLDTMTPVDLTNLYYIDSTEKLHLTAELIGSNLKICYQTGYATFNDIPKPIFQGLMLHTAELYDKQLVNNNMITAINSLYAPYIKFKL